eukprot:2044174-Ditylum_brightwellii.AAC.1
MSFIYFKPRVTWCNPKKDIKQVKFIDHWDAEDSARCVDDMYQTWPVLSDYYGPEPNNTQDKTKAVYGETVKKYLESFDKWSTLLRNE